MPMEEADLQKAMHQQKWRRVERVEKAGSPSSASPSDEQNESQSNSDDEADNHADQSAGSLPYRSQPMTANASIASTLETTQGLSSPAPIDLATRRGGSQPINFEQDNHSTEQEQLQFSVQSTCRSSHALLPPSLAMHLHTANLPADQLATKAIASFTGLMDAPVNSNISLSSPNGSPELRLSSSLRSPWPQLNPSLTHVPTQLGNDKGTRPPWPNVHPLQKQTFEPSMQSRPHDIQVQSLFPHASMPSNNGIYAVEVTSYHQLPNTATHQGMEPYNVGSSLPLHLEASPSPGNFNAGLGVRGSVLNGNIDLGDPSLRPPVVRPQGPQMNLTWVDMIHSDRIPQQGDRIPQVQDTQNLRQTNRYSGFNSVYDPMYEAMGLPIDPHLRMFLASKNDSCRK